MRKEIGLALFLLGVLVSPTWALEATPIDRYEKSTIDEIRKFKAIKEISSLSHEASAFSIFYTTLDDIEFIVFRACTEKNDEYCDTFFFSGSLAFDSLLAISYLPPMTTYSEQRITLCESCDPFQGLIFIDHAGTRRAVFLQRYFIVFSS